jgi:hypothetical protein
MVVEKDERDQIDPGDRAPLRALIEARYRADAVSAIEACNPILSHRSVRAAAISCRPKHCSF